MAWTKFTDYLTGPAIVHRDLWNELVDAFVERLLASGRSAAISSAQITAAKSPSPTRRISFTRPNGTAATDMLFHAAIQALDGVYRTIPGDTSPTAIGAELGYSSAHVSEVFGTPMTEVKTTLYLNVCRRIIQRLRYPLIEITGTLIGDALRANGNAANWGAAKTDYYAATETEEADGGRFRSTLAAYQNSTASPVSETYKIRGQRRLLDAKIPATGPFSNYEMFAAIDAQASDEFSAASRTFVEDNFDISVGLESVSHLFTAPVFAPGDVVKSFGATLSATGTVALDMKIRTFDSDTAIDDYEPVLLGADPSAEKGSSFFLDSLYAEPTFTHPFEVII